MLIDSHFWDQVKFNMKGRNLNNKLLDTWLDPIEYLNTAGSEVRPKIVLGVPNAFHQYFVIENLQDKIYSEISDLYNSQFEVEFVVTGNKVPTPPESPQALEEAIFNPAQPANHALRNAAIFNKDKPFNSDPLNIELTFSTFVVGKNSEFAHAATYNVTKNPGGDDYNPLYIYGPVGMGKTHLLHAAGNYIRESYPQLRIIYISAEHFMNECISSIRHHKMDKFRQKYRENADILLVDDVQFIGKGEAVQEEFFHTINTFIERKNR
jgi:chromosomal replication initiator protein